MFAKNSSDIGITRIGICAELVGSNNEIALHLVIASNETVQLGDDILSSWSRARAYFHFFYYFSSFFEFSMTNAGGKHGRWDRWARTTLKMKG